MLKDKEFPVYGDNGLRGVLLSPARFLDPSPEKRVRLEDGREIRVPSNALVAQPDGSYYLQTPAQTEQPPEPAPMHAETAAPVAQEPPPLPANPGANAQPLQEPPSFAAPAEPKPRQIFTAEAASALFREDCDVQRVPVKKIIEHPAEVRQDGDTMIIPLMEEVLVIQKKLLLREEIHITRRRETKADDARKPIAFEDLHN